MRIKISKTNRPQDLEDVSPSFIYNRFDLFYDKCEYEAVKIRSDGTVKTVEYRLEKDQAELGLWLTPITPEELEQLIAYIRKNHPNVKKISYKNGVLPYGKARAHNHFRIVFPETVEEMESRISSKSRAKMRKKLRHAEEQYGPLRVLEYDRSDLPDEVVETFFRFKQEIRGRVYNMTPVQYLNRYNVSHCYVMMFGDTVGAIRFSCEQCPIVYGENFTYNPEMKEYSLGRAIFVHHLIRMVEKKHTELFFAGGDYEYKTHYGSIEETLYDCEITLPAPEKKERESFKKRLKRFLKAHLPPKVVAFLGKVLRKVRSIIH